MPTHDLLAGRTIVVTGAATGIGQAFAIGAAALRWGRRGGCHAVGRHPTRVNPSWVPPGLASFRALFIIRARPADD